MKIATVSFCKLRVNYTSFTVDVDCRGKNSYDYIIPDDMLVGVGDYCLVGIRNDERCEVVRIINIQDEEMYSDFSKDKLMPLASKIDFDYLHRYVTKKERKEKLEKLIDEKYKKVSKLKILESMAKEDNSLAALIDEYKSLD